MVRLLQRKQDPFRERLKPQSHPPSIALPPPSNPTPVLAPLALTLASLVLQNARPLAEALLTRHLHTRTRISSLSISPVRAHLSDLTFSDASDTTLLKAAVVNVSISYTGFLRGRLAVLARGVDLDACIRGTDFANNNWSTHLALLAKKLPRPSTSPEPTFTAERMAPPRWEFSARAEDTTVTLSSTHTGWLARLPLPVVTVQTRDVESVATVSRLVDGLVGRAVRDAGVRAFPRVFRDGARRAARRVAVNAIDSLFGGAGLRVRRLRKRVERVERFVQDMSDVDEARRILGGLRGALSGLEVCLGGGGRSDECESGGGCEGVPREIEGYREIDDE